MVLEARIPCRLSSIAYLTYSSTRIAKSARVARYSYQIPIHSKTTNCFRSSSEGTVAPAFPAKAIRARGYDSSRQKWIYEQGGKKDSLRYTNLGQCFQTAGYHSASAVRHGCDIQNELETQAIGNVKPNPPQPNSKDTYSPLSEELRRAMRGVAYPIAVVTSGPVIDHNAQTEMSEQSSNAGREFLRGLLVSSFNTVTLKPEPYVSFNIKLPSRTWDAITQTQEFMVHLMCFYEVAQKFAVGQSSGDSTGNAQPVEPATALDELSKGRLFGLRCKLTSHHEVGDHVIVVGNVLEVMPRSSASSGTSMHEHLLWKEGKWHTAQPLEDNT